MRTTHAAAAAVALLLFTRGAAAQPTTNIEEPDPAQVRVRIGPLWMSPKLALTNLGVDGNVFNESEDQQPKSDFTFTLTPTTDLWLRAGNTWIVGKVAEDVTWYQTYSSQRNANTAYSVGWHLPFSRVGFKVDAAQRSSRTRPGFEIDTRAQRTETEYSGLAELRALSKTYIGVTASRQHVDFDPNAVFLDTNLRTALNHFTTSAGLSLRHQLTPLTSISLTAKRTEDRFEFSSLRDSSSTEIAGNVLFDKFALIHGGASFGYTNFHPESAGLADYRGLTASANLSYVLMGMTRVGFELGRDVQYSYEVDQPYYVQTRVGGSVTQQIFGPFDLIARGSTASLAYQSRTGIVVVTLPDRTDRVYSFGGGLGYHLGKDTRLGFNVDQTNRNSDVTSRQYKNLTFGTSVTYDF